jgi:hypothetical protein
VFQADVVTEFMEGLLEGSSTEEDGVFGPQPMEGDDGRPPSDVCLSEDIVERLHVEVDIRHEEDMRAVGPPRHLQ